MRALELISSSAGEVVERRRFLRGGVTAVAGGILGVMLFTPMRALASGCTNTGECCYSGCTDACGCCGPGCTGCCRGEWICCQGPQGVQCYCEYCKCSDCPNCPH